MKDSEARLKVSPNGTQELMVCLAGMPNSGKTTLMNALTGGSFHTGNYPGITVSLLKGRSQDRFGEAVTVVDLPGVHSTVACSPEEELSTAVILGKHHSVQSDVFVVVVDATQIERHLWFASFVARQQQPMVIALTMVDILPRLKQSIDVAKLESSLGIRIIAVNGRTGQGSVELLKAVRAASQEERAPHRLAQLPSDPTAAYREIQQLLRESLSTAQVESRSRANDPFTGRVDRVVLHRVYGFPIFFIILVGLFAAIFWAAQPLMSAVDSGFSAAGDLVRRLPGGIVTRFLADGVVHGVGVVAVFFPQVLILFFLMTLLEDSGYLARGAALIDRPLRWLGLHGRSFVPMLSGFACAIPATLAARAVPAKRERWLTIWILPLMSCSARLPVYALLLAALMPRDAPWQSGFGLAAIYVGSLLTGSIVAGVIGRFFLPPPQSVSLLAMELPLYRRPQLKLILKMTWARASAYLKRAGRPIVIIASCLWFLSNFGPGNTLLRVSSTPLDRSYAAQLGHLLEPALRPMGADWRVGIGLISAFAAREVFVSSLAIVFHVAGEKEAQTDGLLKAMSTAKIASSDHLVFTTASIIGLIVFFFFSLQCFSTVAVVRKETNSPRFVIAQLLFYTILGYTCAVLTVQGLRLVGVE